MCLLLGLVVECSGADNDKLRYFAVAVVGDDDGDGGDAFPLADRRRRRLCYFLVKQTIPTGRRGKGGMKEGRRRKGFRLAKTTVAAAAADGEGSRKENGKRKGTNFETEKNEREEEPIRTVLLAKSSDV